MKTIFSPLGDENSIRWWLAHPPIFRSSGWSLETLGSPIIVEGKFIRVRNGDRKVIDLYENGLLVLGVSAGAGFLSWGAEYKPHRQLNPLAVVEIVSSFVRFYLEKVIPDAKPIPKKVSFGAGFRRLHNNGQN